MKLKKKLLLGLMFILSQKISAETFYNFQNCALKRVDQAARNEGIVEYFHFSLHGATENLPFLNHKKPKINFKISQNSNLRNSDINYSEQFRVTSVDMNTTNTNLNITAKKNDLQLKLNLVDADGIGNKLLTIETTFPSKKDLKIYELKIDTFATTFCYYTTENI